MNLAMPAATNVQAKKRPGARKHNRAFQTSKAIMQLITQTSNLTMSSREIADLVEARHNDVIATIERLFTKGLLRSSRESRQEATGGRPIEVYDLTRRDCYLVAAGYSDELRARIIDRWQELESQQAPKPAELSRMDILQLALDAEHGRIKAEAALAIAAPKAAFVDQYVDASTLMGFRQVAKLLKANENHFRLFLIEKKVMYRLAGEWVAYQNHIDAGRFSVKTGEANGHAFNRSMFTPKGVEWVAGEFAKFQLAQNEEVPA